MQINYFYTMQWNKRNAMICIQLKIKCKIILLKTLENGLNKSYLMTYQSSSCSSNSLLHCHTLVKIGGLQGCLNSLLEVGCYRVWRWDLLFVFHSPHHARQMLVRLMHPPSLCFSWLFWSWCLIGSPFLKASKVALVVGPNLCENVLLGYLQMYPC